MNVLRCKLSDEEHALEYLVQCVGASEKRGGVEQALAVLAKVRKLGDLIRANFWDEITAEERDQIVAGLDDLAVDVRGLERIRCEVSGMQGFLRDNTPAIHAQISKLRSMLAPTETVQPAPRSLMGRITEAFGWGDAEAEAV